MCNMCHFCGAELGSIHCDNKLIKDNFLNERYSGSIWCCMSCQGKHDQCSLMEASLKYEKPTISPEMSFSSSNSFSSNSSDYSVDASSSCRTTDEEGSICTSRKDFSFMPDGCLHDSTCPSSMEGIDVSNKVAHGHIAGRDENGIAEMVPSTSTSESEDSNAPESIEGLISEESPGSEEYCFVDNDLNRDATWEPPEPDNLDDEIGGIADYEDDYDCSGEHDDGTKLRKSNSFSESTDDLSSNYNFKQEKHRAMNEVMNGKFKALVDHLCKSFGISNFGNDGESWIDVITYLAWEAALYVKPDITGGKAMDIDGFVKVKCIASGSCSESKLIKGLVFKKHVAHKHMPASYKNPRLLLVRGMLGQPSSGLSSFDLMEQEKTHLKSAMDMIEKYKPNVVLVEKTASRDVQEFILKKGITLVFDMKLHRLERIARYTGSPILYPESFISENLKRCDYFHFERFKEEHARSVDSGKRPSKTLMFLEGCPTRHGCTVLIKGSHNDELKKIKYVIQCAFVVAYHLILETSFLVDQKAMFCTIPFVELRNVLASDQQSTGVGVGDATDKPVSTCIDDIPISYEESSHFGLSLECEGTLSSPPHELATFPPLDSLEASLKKVIGDHFSLSSVSYQSLSLYFGFDGANQTSMDVMIFPYAGAFSPFYLETRSSIDAKTVGGEQDFSSFTLRNDAHMDEKASRMNSETQKQTKDDNEKDSHMNGETQKQTKDDNDIGTMLDSQSILVLMSSRNAMRGTICEQSRFSHIKFYKNFDIPLGRFLRDNLLNQRNQCITCGEPPSSHFYYYAHYTKQLTIQVRLLPISNCLPGEAEGKLWMWSRCTKCKSRNGVAKSTKRVVISAAARRLSFGKFLELSFSLGSSLRHSNCSHSLDKDFLYFFGMGSMVAMFRYSALVTYTVSMPRHKMQFSNAVYKGCLDTEIENVQKKGKLLFQEIKASLKKVESQLVGPLSLPDGPKNMQEIVKPLQGELSDFEGKMMNASSTQDQSHAHILLYLNHLLWELLLESCIWDRRLHFLLSSKPTDCDHALENELSPDGENVTFIPIDAPDGEAELYDSTREGSESSVVLSTDIPESSQNFLEESRSLPIHFELEKTHPGKTCNPLFSQRGYSLFRSSSNLDDLKQCIWSEFKLISRDCMQDLQRGYFMRIEPLGSHTQQYLPQVHEFIKEYGSRLHIPLTDQLMVLDYEDELSSIIACALGLLKDSTLTTDDQSVNSFRSMESNRNISESRLSSFDGLNLLNSLVSFGELHPEVSLGIGKLPAKGKYLVVCLYASRFLDLRRQCCSSELDYITSLSHCRIWDAKGGKSKAFFSKTLDGRFIIKEIKKTEFDSFMKFAPDYFKYMNQAVQSQNQTCLAKILGIYQVRLMKNGKEMKHDLMVMENLTFGRNITRHYDLKGALHARFNSAADGSEDVLLDQNFVNDMNASPLYVSNQEKRLLQRAVWNDTTFLNSINVMDYSLLVGVDGDRLELVCGIIDYLRQYTWDKQLETWVKSSLVVPKHMMPTIISPIEYKKRFRKFMSTHFLSVPDTWCSEKYLDSSSHSSESV